MTLWYKRFEFWTLILGAIAELIIGFGWPEQAALLASIGGTVIAALVAGGIVRKEEIKGHNGLIELREDHAHYEHMELLRLERELVRSERMEDGMISGKVE